MNDLSKNARELLKTRYCYSDEEPKDVLTRISTEVGQVSNRQEEYKDIIYDLDFLPNSPVLFNAGYSDEMAACFVIGIEDSIESIFEAVTKMAKIQKASGGTGFSFSKLREKGAPISGGGKSTGAISFMKIFDAVTDAIRQGGKRRGASLGVLSSDHPEIIDFIKEKIANGTMTNFNLSVMCTDDFMKKVMNNERYILRSRKDGSIKNRLRARDIFKMSCYSSWLEADPGFLFYDTINKDSNFEEEITACNPCQPSNAILLDNDVLKRIDCNAKNWTSWKVGKKELLELRCNNGLKLRFTPEHRIKTKSKGFKKAKDLLNERLEWGLGNRNSNTIDFKQIIRGFLFGDGFECGNGYGVSVKLNKNKESTIYDLLLNIGFNKQDSGPLYENKERLNKKIDVTFLKDNLPFRNLPKDVLFGDSEKVKSFLRGLFEANGSVNEHSQISLKATNKSMIEKVQVLLASFGIPSYKITNKEQWIEWRNGKYKSRESYNLQIAPTCSYDFKEKIGFVSSKKNSKIRRIDGNYRTDLKVVEIKSLGKKEVWDYQMLESPDYNFCQGVIAKNCSEKPLPDGGACVLGSINLANHVEDGSFQESKFKRTVRLGTKYLLDINKICNFPIVEAYEIRDKYNPIGLGVMGFADMLMQMEIEYDSREALKQIRKIGKILDKVSNKEAPESADRTTVAPTGSLSIIADCSSGIEPIYSLKYTRETRAGAFEEIRNNPYLRTAHEVSPMWHLRVQTEWQKYITSGISKTINLPKNASVEQIEKVYLEAWKRGAKGITVYRDKSKDKQVYYSCDDEECYL